MSNKNNVLTVEVKATEINEVKDIITSFIFMLEDNRIDYRIRKQYLESCKYLSHISEIKFCPYCGKELEEVK